MDTGVGERLAGWVEDDGHWCKMPVPPALLFPSLKPQNPEVLVQAQMFSLGFGGIACQLLCVQGAVQQLGLGHGTRKQPVC